MTAGHVVPGPGRQTARARVLRDRVVKPRIFNAFESGAYERTLRPQSHVIRFGIESVLRVYIGTIFEQILLRGTKQYLYYLS